MSPEADTLEFARECDVIEARRGLWCRRGAVEGDKTLAEEDEAVHPAASPRSLIDRRISDSEMDELSSPKLNVKVSARCMSRSENGTGQVGPNGLFAGYAEIQGKAQKELQQRVMQTFLSSCTEEYLAQAAFSASVEYEEQSRRQLPLHRPSPPKSGRKARIPHFGCDPVRVLLLFLGQRLR